MPRREMQPLAGLEVEPGPERACDRNRRSRAQGFLQGPECLRLIRSLDQDYASRIETEARETMSVEPAPMHISLGRDQEPRAGEHAAEKRRHETEGGRHVRFVGGDDLMESTKDEPSLRQTGIKRR